MRLPAAAKKKARIEIIPMIDTMFFLLVFFMMATLAMTLQKGLQVNLPTVGSATEAVSEQASLTLTKNGDLFFNKEAIGIPELELRLESLLNEGQEPSVVINADEAVSHGRVIEVMDSVRKTGITNMAFAIKPQH